MAGQIIVAGIGVICYILALLSGETDIGKYPLIIFGTILIGISIYSYFAEKKALRGRPIGQAKPKGLTLEVDDWID